MQNKANFETEDSLSGVAIAKTERQMTDDRKQSTGCLTAKTAKSVQNLHLNGVMGLAIPVGSHPLRLCGNMEMVRGFAPYVLQLSRTLYKSDLFMQNKPNFKKAQMNVSIFL